MFRVNRRKVAACVFHVKHGKTPSRNLAQGRESVPPLSTADSGIPRQGIGQTVPEKAIGRSMSVDASRRAEILEGIEHGGE